MTVTLYPFIHIEEFDRCGEFAKFAETVVPRVKLRGLLSDITAHSAQMSPSALVGSRLKSGSEECYQFGISFQLVCGLRFNGSVGTILEPKDFGEDKFVAGGYKSFWSLLLPESIHEQTFLPDA